RGVVRRRDRRAEHRLDLVADELQHEAAMRADGRLHLGEIAVEVAHDLPRLARFDPRREVAEVGEEHGDLALLALDGDPAGKDLVADLAADVTAERRLDRLALA